MDLSCLDKILSDEPKYRFKQIKEIIFKNLTEDWSDAIGLPLQLREKLKEKCSLEIKGGIAQSVNKNVSKAVIALDDGLKIESVLMRHGNNFEDVGERNTVCVSSQVGCPMGCEFCATGAMGFKRNLTAWEIIEQVLFFARLLKKENERVSNVVFMGMGEPFLNYENVIAAIRVLNDKDGFNIGARKISISTCGIIEGIEKLAKENIQVNLAISLHAPSDDLRTKLMPVNKKYPLAKVLKAVDGYIGQTSRQVTFEYLLLRGINDFEECAEKLAKLMRKPLYFVNLITYNFPGRLARRSLGKGGSFGEGGLTGKKGLEPSFSGDVKKFKEILEKAGVKVSQRYRFGRNIKAACGQLAIKD